MAKKASKSRVIERALIVGISGYSPPVTPLPAVANDVREMAKLLTSKNGAFQKDSVTTLADKAATQDAILDGCKVGESFSGWTFAIRGEFSPEARKAMRSPHFAERFKSSKH